jgi:diguanylate cyclase (GGDEF)-like protein/PAS domain S-box-containing protein
VSAAQVALGRLDAAGFALIGVLACVAWIRQRGRTRACLAVALGLLGTVVVIGQIATIVNLPRTVSVVDVLLFVASGYALVELRHTLLPVSRVARSILLAILAVTTALAVPLALAPKPNKPAIYGVAVACLLILEWCACVVEPALRFRLAARGLAVVQRKRLRALSTAYLGIAIALVLAVGTAAVSAALAKAEPAAMSLTLQIVATTAIPLFYVGFAPPRWLRRHWRQTETEAYRRANAALLAFAADPAAMAERAVEWAMRFVGARAGFVLGRDGVVLASGGQLDDGELQALASLVGMRKWAQPQLLHGNVAVVPLRGQAADDMLVVVPGAFSPLFGTDELRTLSEFADGVAVAMDRVRLSQELRNETDRMQSLLEALSELGAGLLIADSGQLVYANDAFAMLAGYSGDELVGMELVALSPVDDRDAVEAQVLRSMDGDPLPWHLEGRLLRKDGRVIDVETVVNALAGGRTPRRRIALVQDISARKRAERKLAEAARIDPLTGVANRRAWNERLALSLADAARDSEPLSVGLLDLDGFKEFNDDWGHQRGDDLLATVAQGWYAALREEDFLARYGGDEFAVLMPRCAAEDAAAAVQRLTEVAPERASAGVAQWDGRETADELVARADAALLRSKRERIGSVTLARFRSGDRVRGWIETLERVLDRRLVRAAYQPIVCFDNGETVGFEALLRPNGAAADGSVEDLFAAAQKLGYARDLDWVSRRAALEGAAALPPGAALFVNVSARALLDPVHSCDQMLMLLRWTGRRADEVVLEISEREVIRNLGRFRTVLAEYRHHGFRFALDDVGEGHSTLEVLEAAGAEYIKLAGRLTQHATEPSAAGAIRAVATFAQSSGGTLIAEGIADTHLVTAMQGFGIRHGQGYALGRPAFMTAAPLDEREPAAV